jgi:hypothetical protein
MKCYFCQDDAGGTCSDCSRGVCKTRSTLHKTDRVGAGTDMRLICNECDAEMQTGNAKSGTPS